MISLKAYTSDLLEEFADLCVTTFKQAYTGVHHEEDLERYCREHYSNDALSFILSRADVSCKIAYDRSRPVGFTVLKHHECPLLPGEASSELKQIYVLADAYGSGVGGALFEDAIEIARHHASRNLWLIVSSSNDRALRFYGKNGFEVLGDGPDLVVGKDRLHSTILRMALT